MFDASRNVIVILENNHGMSRQYESSNHMWKNDGGCSKGEMVSPFESRRSVALLNSVRGEATEE